MTLPPNLQSGNAKASKNLKKEKKKIVLRKIKE